MADLARGELRVHVHRQDLPTRLASLSAWTFLTEGFEKHGHRELVLTILREPSEEPARFPHALFDFFSTVFDLSKQGHVAQPGSFTDLGPTGLLDLERFGAVAWVTRRATEAIGPPSALAGIVLTREERQLTRMAGLQRVLARLGRDTRQFPFPAWLDRKRVSVAVEKEFEKSFLAMFQVAGGPGMHAWMEGKTVVVSLSSPASAFVRAELAPLPSSTPFALLTELPPAVRAAFVWQPGQTRAEAIRGDADDAAADGPFTLGRGALKIASAFVAFIPGQAVNGGSLVEDGFAFGLRDATSVDVRDAIVSGKPIAVPATGDGFALELRPGASPGLDG